MVPEEVDEHQRRDAQNDRLEKLHERKREELLFLLKGRLPELDHARAESDSKR